MFFENVFPVVMRNVAGYVMNGNRKKDWEKFTADRIKLKKEILNRLLVVA